MPSNHLILCHPLLLPPSIFPSIRVFSNESALRFRWPKYWSFSFSVSPSNEYSGLISFRMDWLDLLSVQGTLKNLLQHHSSKVSILWCSAFFIVQLSHPYMITMALTRQTFISKVMSLLFNMPSRLVISFFPRSKHLSVSRLPSPSAVILEKWALLSHYLNLPLYISTLEKLLTVFNPPFLYFSFFKYKDTCRYLMTLYEYQWDKPCKVYRRVPKIQISF